MPGEDIRLVDTPDVRTIAELVAQFSLPVEKTVKTLLVHAREDAGHPSTASDYAANMKLVEAVAPARARAVPGEDIRLVDTPDVRTIAE
ncbi:hypothetical protein CE195_07785, partial [Sodalis-like symbiont of Philaenus spumarius]